MPRPRRGIPLYPEASEIMSEANETASSPADNRPSRAGRPRGVWWWAAHKRWTFTVAGKRHKAPKEIGPEDVDKANRWYVARMRELYPDLPVQELPTAGRVGRKYGVRAQTHRRLLRMARAESEATGKKVRAGHVIDRLVREASGRPRSEE